MNSKVMMINKKKQQNIVKPKVNNNNITAIHTSTLSNNGY